VTALRASSREQLFELLGSRELQRDLYDFACKRTGSKELARDLMSRTVSYILDTNAAGWNRARYATLLQYMASVLSRLLWAHRIKASTRRDVRRPPEVLERFAADSLNPEDDLLTREELDAERPRVERRLATLRQRILDEDGDGARIALRLIELELEGIHKPADQAAAMNVPAQAIYRARESVAGHIDRVLETESPVAQGAHA
jgi:hypothetical protein